MLTVQSPFILNGTNNEELFENIKACNMKIPEKITKECK
jgi:hypothetical protein